MPATRRSVSGLVMLAFLGAAGCALWVYHAGAWSLGRRSPVLDGEAATHALAARELARHGALRTPFALPITLARHPSPPWPLVGVEPGMVALEALAFRLAPDELNVGGLNVGAWSRPDQAAWLVVPIAFTSFLLLGLTVALAVLKLLQSRAPDERAVRLVIAATACGLALMLDPEAQHFAAGGRAELPYALGMMGALMMLAMGLAPIRPFAFGLVVGIATAFRTEAAGMGPLLALAALAGTPRERRLRVLLIALAGFALPLAPWWIYQLRAPGGPAWAIERLALWDGVGGRSLFAMLHVPAWPDLPRGWGAVAPLLSKLAANLPPILLGLLTGPRALWIGALAVFALGGGEPRGPRLAARTVLVWLLLACVAAALTASRASLLFPARLAAEVAGVLATLALAARVPALTGGALPPLVPRVLAIALVIGWGGWQTARGASHARAAALEGTTPSPLTLLQVSVLVGREVPPGEPVACNLGSQLAWYARRPVVHLPLTPEDLEACRERLELRNVMLVFRGEDDAWPGWRDIVARPLEASHRPELNIRRVRVYRSADGFQLVWLELGPLAPKLAASGTQGRSGSGQRMTATRLRNVVSPALTLMR